MDRGGRGKAKSTKREDQRNICFSWDDEFSEYSTCADKLGFFSDFERALILSSLRFAHWPTRWDDVGREGKNTEKWADILSLVECLEVKLTTCIDARVLVKSNLMLIAALTGQQIDLGAVDENEDFWSEIKDYTQTGLANRLGPEAAQDSPTTISARLEFLEAIDQDLSNIQITLTALQNTLDSIRAALAAEEAEHIEDELQGILTTLAEIGVVVGV